MKFDLLVKSGASHNLQDTRKEVMVKVVDTKSNYVWLWSKGNATECVRDHPQEI